MRRLLVPWLVALVVLAVAYAPAKGAGSPTAAVYRAKASALCATLRRVSPTHSTSKGSVASLVRRSDSTLASLMALRAPASLTFLRLQVVDLLRQEKAYLDAQYGELKAGQITAARFRTNVGRVSFTPPEVALWRKIGARACAKP